jgi:succinyl-CoA synthetase beta subunit
MPELGSEMRLHEYQAKRILSQFGVPVPRGQVATSVSEVRQIAEELGARVVLKAQVLTGGRGRGGGIRLANDVSEAEQIASQMFGMEVNGYIASRLLVDEAVEIEQEVYLAITANGLGYDDRSLGQPAIVASGRGGFEIVDLARGAPEVYVREIDPLLGLRQYQARELAYNVGLGREPSQQFVSAAMGLWNAFWAEDATLVEANPLVVCSNGELVSLNARMTIDDDALFRHPELSDLRDESQETATERLARRHGIHYVRLGGRVGCLSNGAGLAMATMDLLRLHGVKAGSFIDIGMGAQPAKMIVGLRLALNGSASAVLVNIFGGLTRCDEVARGILAAYGELDISIPMVVRLEGTNKQAGLALLAQKPAERGRGRLYTAESLVDAVQQVAAAMQPEGAQ